MPKKFISYTLLFCFFTLGLGSLVGCNLAKSILSGDEISQSDVVHAADSERRDYQQDQEDIADTVDAIEEILVEIQESRAEGNFRASEFREDTLDRHLDSLEDLDADHAMLQQAPQRLDEIKQEYSQERYERVTLAEQCESNVETARQARLNENWRRTNSELNDYVLCRRQFIDADGDQSRVDEQDELYKTELEAFVAHLLEEKEEQRSAGSFNIARGTERNIDNHLEYYEEVVGNEDFLVQTASSIEELHETYEDPRVVAMEEAEEAFDRWRARAEEMFEQEVGELRDAEEIAAPIFEEGQAAMDEGNFQEALEKFEEARNTLYENAFSSAVMMDTAVTNGTIQRGLSYEIAAAIAEVHFRQGNRSKMYPELSIIRDGRPWFDDDEEELKIRLHEILADRQGNMAPQPTDQVREYAGDFSDTAEEFRAANDRAQARSGEAYAMLGVNLEPVSHQQLGFNPEEAEGEVIHLEETVSSVSGGQLQFDFRETREVAHNCRSTGEPVGANVYTGEVRYGTTCDTRELEEGYVLTVSNPSGVSISSGDTVELYATVGQTTGSDTQTISLNDPGVVQVMSDGQTNWYLGVEFQ